MKQPAPFLRLNLNDFAKGLIMALLGALIAGIYTSIQSGALPVTLEAWKPIVMGALLAALTYLGKNFTTNSKDEFLKKEPTQEQSK